MWTFSKDLLHCLISVNSCNNVKTVIAQWSNNHGQLCPTIIHNKYFLPRHPIIPFPRHATPVRWEIRAIPLTFFTKFVTRTLVKEKTKLSLGIVGEVAYPPAELAYDLAN